MDAGLRLFSILILCVHITDTHAKLRFASSYGDHMVLQKSPAKAMLWGYAPEGTQINICLSGPPQQEATAVADGEGMWRVSLEPVEAGGPYNVTAASNKETVTLTDVLFGDVWLCGGQSNMEFPTSRIFNASEELRLAADFPHVRFFMVALTHSETQQTDLMAVALPWSVPTAENLSGFSAVCWLFGRYLYKSLKYPIGLVESCYGGTPVEAWSSSRVLQQCGLEHSTRTWAPAKNSVLWNAMIHPLLRTVIKGAIWYQGESNAFYNKDKYNCSFPAMIDDWRMAFHQASGGQTEDDFPFGFVQLCTFTKYSKDLSYPEIRWHQTADFGFAPNQRMRKTFMAVALDLPDESSPYETIHPRDKQDVAHRLMLGARSVAYNEADVTFRGPFPQGITPSAVEVVISYDQALSVTLSRNTFEICCSKMLQSCETTSSWVKVPIKQWNDTKVVLHPVVCPPSEEVTGLRYAWRDWPCDFKACPVYSASSTLPAPPFTSQRYEADGITWQEDVN